MKYETPELTALAPAASAIQNVKHQPLSVSDGITSNEHPTAYADWE